MKLIQISELFTAGFNHGIGRQELHNYVKKFGYVTERDCPFEGLLDLFFTEIKANFIERIL